MDAVEDERHADGGGTEPARERREHGEVYGHHRCDRRYVSTAHESDMSLKPRRSVARWRAELAEFAHGERTADKTEYDEDVADELDVDKSTASGVLRRGEARVLKKFLTGVRDE